MQILKTIKYNGTIHKEGKEGSETTEIRKQIERTVQEIIQEVEKNGDAALGKYSEQFDHWSPECFRLTNEQIRAAVDSVPELVQKDILFAQEQIGNFARLHRAAITDI